MQNSGLFTSFYDDTSMPTNITELSSDIGNYGSYDSNIKVVPSGLSDGLYSLENDFYIAPSGWGHTIHLPEAVRYCARVENNGSDVCFIEANSIPEIVSSDLPDKLDLDSPVTLHASLCNPTSYRMDRYVRAELIQNGEVKGWSSSVVSTLESEETISFEITVDKWNRRDGNNLQDGEYLLCLSMLNSYGSIWIPMGKGKRVTVTGSAAVNTTEAEDNSNDIIYDIYGRKVIRPVPNQLYIRNGQKFIYRM